MENIHGTCNTIPSPLTERQHRARKSSSDMPVYSGATNQISHLEMWTRDSELISLEMLSHHLCPAGPVAWGKGVSNTVITRVEKTTGWMAGPLNDLQFCCWWLNTLLQPVNEQCWSNGAEEGEDLLEVRGTVRSGGGLEVANVLEYTHILMKRRNIWLWKCAATSVHEKLMIGASGYGHIHLCLKWFSDLLFSFHNCWYSWIIICIGLHTSIRVRTIQ